MIPIDEKNADVAAFRQAEHKLADLRSELSKRQRELNDATDKYLAQQHANKSKLDVEAEGLLAIGETEQATPDESIRELAHDVSIYERAVQIQCDVVDKLRTSFSTTVCATVQARYIAIEKRIAHAVQELAKANEAEVQFFDELREAGASPGFRPMRVDAIGTLTDSQSRASFHRREVETYCPEAAA